jgi:hypothetical protein
LRYVFCSYENAFNARWSSTWTLIKCVVINNNFADLILHDFEFSIHNISNRATGMNAILRTMKMSTFLTCTTQTFIRLMQKQKVSELI